MKLRSIALSVIAAGALISSVGTASAATLPTHGLTSNQIFNLKKHMYNLGIDRKTQIRLLQEMEQGKILDSDNPAYVSKVPSASFSHPIVSYTFPDGSVFKESITVLSHRRVKNTARPTNASGSLITTNGTISGGSSQTGSGYVDYYDVMVSAQGIQTSGSFKVNFDQTDGGTADISWVGDALASANDGTVSNKTVSIVRAHSVTYPSVPAEADFSFDFTVLGFVNTQTRYIQFYVTDSQYWENDNFS